MTIILPSPASLWWAYPKLYHDFTVVCPDCWIKKHRHLTFNAVFPICPRLSRPTIRWFPLSSLFSLIYPISFLSTLISPCLYNHPMISSFLSFSPYLSYKFSVYFDFSLSVQPSDHFLSPRFFPLTILSVFCLLWFLLVCPTIWWFHLSFLFPLSILSVFCLLWFLLVCPTIQWFPLPFVFPLMYPISILSTRSPRITHFVKKY